jgi:arginyl-tRNA synthetase
VVDVEGRYTDLFFQVGLSVLLLARSLLVHDIRSQRVVIESILRIRMSLNLQQSITESLQRGFGEVLDVPWEQINPVLRTSQNAKHGDLQANGAMALGKRHGQDPRELALRVVELTDFGDITESAVVAGPGFINIQLSNHAIVSMLEQMNSGDLGVEPDQDSHPVAIDLCGVNVAKQLHVGHLRATIIGDTLARLYERLGRTVYRENHLGDWGLPIAMVLERLLAEQVNLDSLTLEELNVAYKEAQLVAKDDVRGMRAAEEFLAGPHRLTELEEQNAGASEQQATAKNVLNALQGGDEQLLGDWQKLIDCTMRSVFASLNLLNVKIGPENSRGESFYRDRLTNIVSSFVERGLAEEDDGAIVVRFKNRERPMLIRKSDGGFLYATTDLAAIEFRTQELGADRAIYVVDARQRDHFKDLFDAATLIGWNKTPDGADVEFVHIPFGSVLGDDKKPLKTRSGSNVTLDSLLQDAAARGTAEVVKRSKDPHSPTHNMSADELDTIGRQIGIGAIKYADLSNDLVRDYVFNMDRMIAFEGNTGPYIQYAAARISSILMKAGDWQRDATVALCEPQERTLALQLLQYNSVIQDTVKHLEPHRLCTWLFELTEAFNSFYQTCPVLKTEDGAIRDSRLKLVHLTRRVIADGLDVLGIDAPQQM